MKLGTLAVVLLMAFAPQSTRAQDLGVVQSDILVLNPDRLFAETQFGKRLNDEYLAKQDELSESNLKIKGELEAEEQVLTDMRAEKSPEEFRALADAFDAKVQEIRRDRDRAARDLELSRERAPVVFMRAVEPVLGQLMKDAGGTVVLDLRSVLLRANVIDITDLAISRIDQQIGEGPKPAKPPAQSEN